MSRICPNCNYTRKETDTAPNWQCPSCGKAYNKGAGADVDQHYGRHIVQERPEVPRTGFVKWLLIAALVGGSAWATRPTWLPTAMSVAQTARPAEQPEVTLYATEWCGYCTATRRFFADNGIHYIEKDIEKSDAAGKQHRALGGHGVPLVVVGDDIIHGFNEAQLRSLLKPWLKK